MEKKRFKEIDILRGMAIVLVLLGHAIIVYPVNLHKILWCNVLFTWLSTVHMPLFFLISGFCYSFRTNEYGRFWWKKTKRLLIPYLAFCILDMLVRITFGSLVNQQRGLLESVKNMILAGGVLVSICPLHHIPHIPVYRENDKEATKGNTSLVGSFSVT